MKGKIINWRDDRQFGFIKCCQKNLKNHIFFHASEFKSGTPEVGQDVEFDLAPDRKGHPDKAVNIVVPVHVDDVNAGAAALAGAARKAA